jgi:hypothetical protein
VEKVGTTESSKKVKLCSRGGVRPARCATVGAGSVARGDGRRRGGAGYGRRVSG